MKFKFMAVSQKLEDEVVSDEQLLQRSLEMVHDAGQVLAERLGTLAAQAVEIDVMAQSSYYIDAIRCAVSAANPILHVATKILRRESLGMPELQPPIHTVRLAREVVTEIERWKKKHMHRDHTPSSIEENFWSLFLIISEYSRSLIEAIGKNADANFGIQVRGIQLH